MDPRDKEYQNPQARSANHSPLMAALSKASLGVKVNFCPAEFGCKVADLDEQGYCRHLVGFTTDGETLEPLKEVKGRLQVVGAEPEKVLPGDILVRITVSSRVYRKAGRPPPEAAEEATEEAAAPPPAQQKGRAEKATIKSEK